MKLADRAERLSPSATLSLDARAKAMIGEGKNVISLATGEPDFDTPGHIKQAAVAALDRGFVRYTAPAGIPELRAAISRKLSRENGIDHDPGRIVVTSGAKQALHNALLVTCQEGDEVVIPAPYWVSYVEQVKLTGAEPVVVDCGSEHGFKMSAELLRAAITGRTRAVMINSPCNPTGAVYSASELAELAAVAVEHGLYVISDEVYEHLVFDGATHVSMATVEPRLSEQAIVVNALSKSYAMTGWRLGWASGPRTVIDAMISLQGHTTSHATSFVQLAAVAALDGPTDDRDRMVTEFDARRRLLIQRLNTIPGFKCEQPEGAFYAFPDVTGCFGRDVAGVTIESSAGLAEVILEQANVAVVPGEAFGAPGYIRLSYALAADRMLEAADRIKNLLAR